MLKTVLLNLRCNLRFYMALEGQVDLDKEEAGKYLEETGAEA